MLGGRESRESRDKNVHREAREYSFMDILRRPGEICVAAPGEDRNSMSRIGGMKNRQFHDWSESVIALLRRIPHDAGQSPEESRRTPGNGILLSS
jgi:hypothetical protein